MYDLNRGIGRRAGDWLKRTWCSHFSAYADTSSRRYVVMALRCYALNPSTWCPVVGNLRVEVVSQFEL
jgi:hypothetical protein